MSRTPIPARLTVPPDSRSTQRDSDLRYEITLVPESNAPWQDHDPFKVVVCASGLDTARVMAFRLLKRTYGDATNKGNPMWWRVEGQRGV